MSQFQILDTLGLSILHSIWQITIVAGIVFLFYKITNQQQARQRYLISYSAMILCLIAFVFTFFRLLPDYTAGITIEADYPGITFEPASSEAIIGLPESEITRSYYEVLTEKTEAYANWIGFLWVIGFLFYTVKHITAFRLANQLRSTGVSDVEEYWQQRIRKLIKESNISDKTELLYSNMVRSPLTVGFFKPLILVPSGFLMNLPPEQVEAVLLHEIAHIKRHDYIFNLVQTFVKTVFFYHPGIRYISRKIDAEREHLCDDFAVGRTNDPTALAKALGFLQLKNLTNQNSFAMTAVKRNHPFLNRLKRLFGEEEQSENLTKSRVIIPVFSLLIFVFAATAYTDAIPSGEDKLQLTDSEEISAPLQEEPPISITRDSFPEKDITDVHVYKKNERIIVTERDPQGNKLKVVEEIKKDGRKRVSATLNGKKIKSKDGTPFFKVVDGKPVKPENRPGKNPENKDDNWFEIENNKVILKGKSKNKTIWKNGSLAVMPPPPPPVPNVMREHAKPSVPPPPPPPPAPDYRNGSVPPPPPPIPDFNFNVDSLPDGADKEKIKHLMKKMERATERLERMVEKQQRKSADKIEKIIQQEIRKEEILREKSQHLTEEELRKIRERREEIKSLINEERHLFEESIQIQVEELQEQAEILKEQLPDLLEEHEFALEELEHQEHLFERGIEEEHELLGGMNEDDLKELRNDLRKELINDDFIKNKRKKAVIKILSEHLYSVNGKKMSANLYEKYHNLFHENDIPHEPGTEIRIYKNIFQVGREVGNGFRGLTVIFD